MTHPAVHELKNNTLRVEILDPVNDRSRLGTRYCWGGYVWQVHDSLHGPLLSGPEFPDEPDDVFNGQGIPEVLRSSVLLTGEALTIEKGRGGLIMGVGRLDSDMHLHQACTWSIEHSDTSLTFQTGDAALGWGYALTRTLELDGRRLTSRTRVKNTGMRPLPTHWFAHPFFPLTAGTLVCQLHFEARMPGNPAYSLEDGFIRFKKPFRTYEENEFVMLEIDADTPFEVTLSHPAIEAIRVSGDFTLAALPIWANGNTFSIEPYIRRVIEPGDVSDWSLTYTFQREIP